MTQPRSTRARIGFRRRGVSAGFTLVELVVTILILTIGLLGLAGTAAVVAKQMGSGSKNSVAAVAAQARLDSLASYNCASLGTSGSGTSSVRSASIIEHWKYTDGNDIKNVIDSVWIAGRRNPFVYTSIIPCRD